MTTRDELLSWTKEKLADELLKRMNEDEARRAKVRDWGKKWREDKKKELEELRKFKEAHK